MLDDYNLANDIAERGVIAVDAPNEANDVFIVNVDSINLYTKFLPLDTIIPSPLKSYTGAVGDVKADTDNVSTAPFAILIRNTLPFTKL